MVVTEVDVVILFFSAFETAPVKEELFPIYKRSCERYVDKQVVVVWNKTDIISLVNLVTQTTK